MVGVTSGPTVPMFTNELFIPVSQRYLLKALGIGILLAVESMTGNSQGGVMGSRWV